MLSLSVEENFGASLDKLPFDLALFTPKNHWISQNLNFSPTREQKHAICSDETIRYYLFLYDHVVPRELFPMFCLLPCTGFCWEIIGCDKCRKWRLCPGLVVPLQLKTISNQESRQWNSNIWLQLALIVEVHAI